MPPAQKLQKIFPVVEGDHAQGPSCSVERQEEVHHETARFHPTSSTLFFGSSGRYPGILHQRLRLQQLGPAYSRHSAAAWVKCGNARVGTVGDRHGSIALSVTCGMVPH